MAAVTTFGGVPCAAGQTIKGRPFPSFSREASVEAFMDMEIKEDDIVMLSYPKAGTTWANKMLYLLVRTDEDGERIPGLPEPDIGERGQVYPDWVPVRRRRVLCNCPHPDPVGHKMSSAPIIRPSRT